MYRTFEEEVFLAPEAIISGVLDAAAFDDLQWLADSEPDRHSRRGADAEPAAAGDGADAGTDGPSVVHPTADPVDAWSRHARGANGFGG